MNTGVRSPSLLFNLKNLLANVAHIGPVLLQRIIIRDMCVSNLKHSWVTVYYLLCDLHSISSSSDFCFHFRDSRCYSAHRLFSLRCYRHKKGARHYYKCPELTMPEFNCTFLNFILAGGSIEQDAVSSLSQLDPKGTDTHARTLACIVFILVNVVMATSCSYSMKCQGIQTNL